MILGQRVRHLIAVRGNALGSRDVNVGIIGRLVRLFRHIVDRFQLLFGMQKTLVAPRNVVVHFNPEDAALLRPAHDVDCIAALQSVSANADVVGPILPGPGMVVWFRRHALSLHRNGAGTEGKSREQFQEFIHGSIGVLRTSAKFVSRRLNGVIPGNEPERDGAADYGCPVEKDGYLTSAFELQNSNRNPNWKARGLSPGASPSMVPKNGSPTPEFGWPKRG